MTRTLDQTSSTVATKRPWLEWARSILGGKAGAYGLGIALAVAGAAVFWAAERTGSLGAGIALLRGESIYVSARGPVIVDASAAVLSGSATIELCNLSDALSARGGLQ